MDLVAIFYHVDNFSSAVARTHRKICRAFRANYCRPKIKITFCSMHYWFTSSVCDSINTMTRNFKIVPARRTYVTSIHRYHTINYFGRCHCSRSNL